MTLNLQMSKSPFLFRKKESVVVIFHVKLPWRCSSVMLRSGVGAPVVSECEGEYRHDSRKNILEWNLPLIDQSNKTGALAIFR